jgi:lipopolysaccharide export system protein LptC
VIVLTAAFLVSGAILLVKLRSGPEKSQQSISSLMADTKVYMGQVRQTATQDGTKQWVLDAESAKLSEDGKQTFLKNIRVTFFMKNSGEVRLTADEGILYNDSNNIEVMGNVFVENESGTLSAQKMLYDHGEKVLTCKNKVLLKGLEFNVEADVMYHDLKSNQTKFSGNVRSVLNDALPL